MKTIAFKSVLNSAAGLMTLGVFGIWLPSDTCLGGEAGSYDARQLEQAIRALVDNTIEIRSKSGSSPAEYYTISGPQLQGQPHADVSIDSIGHISIWFIRRYKGWKDELEQNTGVDKHMIAYCDDAHWDILCETMNAWALPNEKQPEVYKNADTIALNFRRDEIPSVIELLVTKVWHIPLNKLQISWTHQYYQM